MWKDYVLDVYRRTVVARTKQFTQRSCFNYRQTIPRGRLSTERALTTSRQPLIFSVPLRGQGRKRAQIYSPSVPRETLHLVHHLLRSPSSSYCRLLLTLYTSICYAAVLCATVGARGWKECRLISPDVLDRRSLPWLYLTSIIKINRPISYVKYYRGAFLNILSLSTFPQLPNGCRVPPFLSPPEHKGNSKRDAK